MRGVEMADERRETRRTGTRRKIHLGHMPAEAHPTQSAGSDRSAAGRGGAEWSTARQPPNRRQDEARRGEIVTGGVDK